MLKSQIIQLERQVRQDEIYILINIYTIKCKSAYNTLFILYHLFKLKINKSV